MRIQDASVASSKHNTIVALKRPRSNGARLDPRRHSSAQPLLSWLKLSCSESHRNLNPPLPLAKYLLKPTSISRQGVFIPSLRKSGQLDLESMKKKEYAFSISKQPSGTFFFFPNRVTPNWQDFQSYKFPCSQPLLKENFLVNLACVEVWGVQVRNI